MKLPNTDTRIDEIADDIFRISTSVDIMPGGFTFNQFLIRDELPLLFHTGPKGMFELTRSAVATVMKPELLRYVSYSHVEADECGAINEWLALAPQAEAVCSQLGAGISLSDSAIRPARGLADGERLSLGRHSVRWLDAPHLPHGWDAGYMFEEQTRTLLCGDLLSHGGGDVAPITDGDIFDLSEAFRAAFPFAPIRGAQQLVEKIAATDPAVLAIMHGSSYRGNGARLLRQLGAALAA